MVNSPSSLDLGNKILSRLQRGELEHTNPRKKTGSKKKTSSQPSRRDHTQVSSVNQPNPRQNKPKFRHSETVSSIKATDEEKLDPPEKSSPDESRSDSTEGDRHAKLLESRTNEEVNGRDVLLAEIKNLGGTEEDLELVGSLSSSSEEEEVLEDHSEDPQLVQDLKEFMKELDFSRAHPTAQSEEDVPPSHITPALTKKRSKPSSTADNLKRQTTDGTADSTQTSKKKKRHRKDRPSV